MAMSQESQKVPSQIFRWFEKMKNNYEHSIQGVLQRFEQYSHSQQLRIDQANKSHIDSLKEAHQKHLEHQDAQINQLGNDINYYKEQISKQQQTIEQLNGRYDAVMSCLLNEKSKKTDVKDIFADDMFENKPSELIETIATSTLTKDVDSTQQINESVSSESSEFGDDTLFDQAILKRQSGENEQAFQLFEKAAKLGHAKSMGAMGRSFFLGEGTEENHSLGLAWLIHAANQELPQAVERVKHFQENETKLYQEALSLAEQLFS